MSTTPRPVIKRPPRAPAVETPSPTPTPSRREQLRRDRKLVQELERAVGLLRRAIGILEVTDATGVPMPAEQLEQVAKLRAAGRYAAGNALEQDGRA